MSARRGTGLQVVTLSEIIGGKPENILRIATEGGSGTTSVGDAKTIAPVGVDYSRIDYKAFDLLYHGRLGGFELGGLLAKVLIGHIADFVLDRDLMIQVDEPMIESTGEPTVPPSTVTALAALPPRMAPTKLELPPPPPTVPTPTIPDPPAPPETPANQEGMTPTAPPPVQTEETYTNKVLRSWVRRFTPHIKQTIVETLKFGDMFTIVNDDGTLTNVPPTNVEKIIDPYSGKTLGYAVFTVVTEMFGSQAVEVLYRETHTATEIKTEYKRADAPDRPGAWRIATNIVNAVRPNPIGILDIVHWHNDKAEYEAYGYSELYSLLTILRRYDDLLNWAITGNKLMGRPSPVFEGIKNIAEFERMYGRVVTTTSGERRTVIDWKPEQVIVLGDGAQFKLASPQPFASDTKTILSLLFWIIAQHSGVPEFMWGTAVNSNKASVQEQLQPFIKFIGTKRQQFEGFAADPLLGLGADGGVHQLIHIWLRKRSLADNQVNINAPTIVTWPNISSKESELSRRLLEWLYSQGLVTEETALEIANSLMGDPIADVNKELYNAKVQARARQASAIAAQIERGVDAPFGEEEDGSPAASPGTSDGTETGPPNDEPGDNQFTEE